MPDEESTARRRDVIVAGHRGDAATVVAALHDPEPIVRTAALGAAQRCGALQTEDLERMLGDPDRDVRLRAIEVAASSPGDTGVSLLPLLADPEVLVVERAAWACGERSPAEPGVVAVLSEIVLSHPDRLCREAAVAALGAIGDEGGVVAIIAATRDVPTVRRRAVLALAPFAGDDVEAALAAALEDRDWQTRQAAEDLWGSTPD